VALPVYIVDRFHHACRGTDVVGFGPMVEPSAPHLAADEGGFGPVDLSGTFDSGAEREGRQGSTHRSVRVHVRGGAVRGGEEFDDPPRRERFAHVGEVLTVAAEGSVLILHLTSDDRPAMGRL